jgi:hypothetical protein
VEHHAVDEEPDVGDPRDLRVDLGVQLPVHVHLEAGDRLGVPVAHHVHPPGQPAQLGGHRPVRPHLERGVGLQSRAEPVGSEMVGVLVRDEDGARAVEGARIGEHPRVDDQPAVPLAQDDAGVAVLDQLHDSTSMTAILLRPPRLRVPVSELRPPPSGVMTRSRP